MALIGENDTLATALRKVSENIVAALDGITALVSNTAATHQVATVTTSAAAFTSLFTLHADTDVVIFDVGAADIRYSLNSNNPTSTVGFILVAGTKGVKCTRAEVEAMKVIAIGSSSALQVGQFISP